MEKNIKDRHLDVPSEANRDKHIDFIARENGEIELAEERPEGKLAPEKSEERKVEKNRDEKSDA